MDIWYKFLFNYHDIAYIRLYSNRLLLESGHMMKDTDMDLHKHRPYTPYVSEHLHVYIQNTT